MAKGFTGSGVAQVHFDHLLLRPGNGVAEGDARVSKGPRIKDHARTTGCIQSIELIDEGAFMVALKGGQGDAFFFSQLLQAGIDFGQSKMTVDFGLSLTEMIQVGTMQDGETVHAFEAEDDLSGGNPRLNPTRSLSQKSHELVD